MQQQESCGGIRELGQPANHDGVPLGRISRQGREPGRRRAGKSIGRADDCC